jgi:hypothetical protein
MKVTLKDGAPRSAVTVEVNVSKNGNTLEIVAAGVDPAPIVLEFYDGKLTLRVYGEGSQPNVVQRIRTLPAPIVNPADRNPGHAAILAGAEVVQPIVDAANASADFDEAAFDAA